MKILKQKNKQQGVALAIGMILLLIVSIIGITSMKSALLQEKMAGNLKNREIADAAALSLMVDVEKWLFDYYQVSNGVVLSTGSQYIIEPNTTESINFRTKRNLSDGFVLAGADINGEYGNILALEPRFIIESVDPSAIVSSGGRSGALIEFDTPSAGSSELLIYKIVVKSTDTTGHLFSLFESVISVKVR